VEHGPLPRGDVRARVAEVFRLEYARLVASVLRIVRDVDAAEEVAVASAPGAASVGVRGLC